MLQKIPISTSLSCAWHVSLLAANGSSEAKNCRTQNPTTIDFLILPIDFRPIKTQLGPLYSASYYIWCLLRLAHKQ